MENKITELYYNSYVNLKEEPLFFGTARNSQRYDQSKYEDLSNLSMTMQNQFWVPEEIKLSKDKLDKENLSVAENWIFDEQLQKLVMLDSYQGRNPLLTFGQLTTNPEFEACLLEQTYFESRIHARSYSYMIENMYPNPNEIFDRSWKNKTLIKHAKTVTKEGNDLYKDIIRYMYKLIENEEITEEFKENLKEKIILALISMNILEGVRFYLGFSSVWAITEFTGKLPGSSRILAFIQRDEKFHLAFTQTLLSKIKRSKEFKDVYKKLEPRIYDMYFEAAEEEFEWAEHLYSKGSILGMNEELGKQYIKYLCNQRLLGIGLKPIFPEIKTQPLKWINKWVNLHKAEQSLQESEAIDYKTDPIKTTEIDLNKIWDAISKI